MADGFDTQELTELAAEMLKTATDIYPQEVKKFLRDEGTRASRVLRAETKASINRRTGATTRGTKRGKVWRDKDGTWKVRAYNRAPQSTPINQGHWTRNGSKFIPAAGFFPRANETVSREIVGDVEAFIDDMLERGLAL